MKSLNGVKVLCEDKDGNRCQIRLQELINYILANQYKMFTSTTSNRWVAKDRLYYDYPVVIETNTMPYQKFNSEPAIVTYIRYREKEKIRGRIIFLSKVYNGTLYMDLNEKLYEDVYETSYMDDIWYYSLSPDCRLNNGNTVYMCSNFVYNSLENAIRDIFSIANIKDATLWTGVPDSDEYAFVVGALNKDKPETALWAVDVDGHIITKERWNK